MMIRPYITVLCAVAVFVVYYSYDDVLRYFKIGKLNVRLYQAIVSVV